MSTPPSMPRPRLQGRRLQGLLLFCLLSLPLSAQAAVKSWSAAVDGAWDDPAKWSPAGVPAATDSVRIAAAGTYTVTLQGSVAVAQLSVGGNGGNPTLWVQGSTARGNAALRVNGGVTNAGVVRLESTGGATTANLTLPTGTLVNQGTIEINAGTGGQRQLSADLDNRGTLQINAAALLNKVGGVYTNQGEIRVQTGQSLTISGNSQVFNQNGGTLVVDGSMPLTSVTFNFNGGSIPNSPPLLLTSTLNIGAGATNTASFRIRGRSTLTGNIGAGQTVWSNGTTKTDAVLTWTSGLANAGTLRLESSEGVAASNLVLPSGTLTNTGLIEVKKGSGGGRSLIANLDNRGTFTMGTTTRLTQTANGIFDNRGAITLTPTDTLDVAVGTFTNRAGGTLTGGGLLMLDRSTLAGTGTIGANVEAWESTISPGSPVGILRVEGSYYQDAFSEVNIDLGGATAGTGYDRLEVAGEAYFDGGSLNVRLINGYQPGTCDQFDVVGYGSWQQLFETINEPSLAGGLQIRAVYDTDGVKLRVGDGDKRINIVPTELNLAEGGGSQSYRVCLGRRPESQVQITVSPDDQVQVAPVELTFAQAAWSAAQSVAVTAVDDAVGEGLHTGIVSHSASSSDDDFNRTEISQVVAHIEDNEAAPALSVGDVSVTEGNSGTKQAQFTVTLSAASTQTVTVAWATANGTATAGSDYVAGSSTLSFSPGQTSKTLAVTVNGDLVTEPDETFTVNLSNPINATLADAQGQGTITNDDAQASLSINDVAVAEGNSGTRNLTFTVTLSAASSQTVTAAWATANGTATAGSDYVAGNGTVSFSAGQTSRTVVVAINGDLVTEPDETFTLNLSNPTNAILADAQGQGTITNDDAIPFLAVGDGAVSEGNSGTKTLSLAVTLSNPSNQTVTVAYTTANGTASDASDYAAASGTLEFAAGETSKSVAITINGDGLSEPNETFTLNLSNPTNATIADAQGVGTITNDDVAPALSVGDVSAAEGNSGTSPLTFTVALSAASGQTVTVQYATANGTATSGTDYAAASGTLSFAPGETSKAVAVNINGDLVSEPNETFTLNLSNPTNATIGDGQGIGTITNDDAGVSLSVSDVSVAEGNSGTKVMNFAVSLSAASSQNVTVSYATANGTAASGSDYVATSGTLTFTAGQTSKTVAVTINGDGVSEADETLFLNLSNPISATIADNQGIGTITNDDVAPALSVNDVSVNESNNGNRNLNFAVRLSAASTQTVTVSYATANGTATAGSDYVATSGTLTFNAGQTNKTVGVTINGDAVAEDDETFFLNLSNASAGATIADNQGVGTITNDDTNPTISISDASVAEGNSGTKTLNFTATLSAASGRAVNVTYATANGTATAGVDYVADSANLVFTPGTTSRTIAITINGDALNEANEAFTVNLSSPTNVTIADGQGVGTITNDDPVPSVAVNDVAVTEGNTGTAALSFTVSLSAASGQVVTVGYATANGTATSGSDYTAASGTLTFAAGETSKTVSVTANDDALNEADETFTVNLSSPTNATIADGQGVGTIANDDPLPSVAVNDVAVTEGNTGTAALSFTVSLSAASGQVVTVGYATANGTATSGSDYTAASGTLTFAVGQTSQTVAVSVGGDLTFEPNETLALNLSAPTNATVADAQGIGTITNDDATPTIAVNDGSVAEGSTGTAALNFTVTLSNPSSLAITVAYATANGTATSGSDYTATSGTLTFAAGQTSQTVPVTVAGDALNELDETLTLNLSSPTNATIADAQGVGTITNDDPVPTIAVNDVSVTEGITGATAMSFTVSLSAASGQVVTLAYATANGTATSGTDYTAASGTLTFAAGQTSQTVPVTVTGDALNELDETLTLNLSSTTNATIADGQGIGTITNDDPVPTIAVNDVSVTEGNTGTAALNFTVSLSAASGQVVTVAYATANGTAASGTDYAGASGTLTFAAGQTSQTVVVTVTGDVLNEADETLTLNLSSPVNVAIADAQGVGTVTNDDPVPTLVAGDVSAAEGNSGTGILTFTVSLSAASGQTVTVGYATTDSSAVAGSDYTAASGVLTFNPGETSKAVAVTVAGDLTFESNEVFGLNLSAPTNAAIADGQGIGTITNDDATPTIAVNDVSVAEGNSGTSTMSFTVSLSNPSSLAITVAYATANGTAISGTDYTAASGILTFAAGETSKAVSVTLTGDVLNEADETLTLNLSAPTNATIADAQGVGTITNDDPVPTIAVNDVSVTEGNTGTTAMTFTVSLSAASGQAVTVAYATANGTATAGTDYTAASGTLSFAAGTTSQTVAVTIAGDLTFEPNETLTLNLSSPTNATIADAQGVGTITNDDATPTIAVNDVSVTEGNSGISTMSFTVSLSNPSSLAITVAYATANGTATSGSDYTAASGTLTFTAGETSKAVSVTLTGDVLNEADETLTLNVSSPTNATIGDAQGIGTITNDDPVPTIAVNDVSVTEGNTGTAAMTFTVSLSAASGQAVTVAYATANGTATAGTDYTAASGTLTFAAGVTSQTVVVTITGDLTFESNETLTLNLSVPTNATIADAQGIGTITNDDATPAIAVSDVSVTEGNSGISTMSFTVNLSNPSSLAITVAYATANGTATSGSDYTTASGTLTFAAGETSKSVAVSVTGDVVNEADETLTLNLSAPTNATIGDAQGIGTITNDDPVPTIAVNDPIELEGNSGTKNLTFTVSLSAASGQAVTVAYATANGTATAGTDYTAASGTLNFAAGTTSQTVAVTVAGDLIFEPSETLTLNLSTATNAAIADAQGVGTITNDDATPTIAVNDVSVTEGNSGISTMSFTVNLSNPSSLAITVAYATANGTATSGSDYTATSGTLTFAAGETSKSVAVSVTGDAANEIDETLTLSLSAPTNATIADAQGIGTITNDDPVPTIAVNDVSVTEGNTGTAVMTFTTTLSAASGQVVTVAYATANGTATAGSDYTAASGTLTFAAGTTSQTVAVTVSGDVLNETDETLNLNLSTPTNATIADAQGVGTITNDDPVPTIAVNDVAVTEGNTGTAAMTFTVSLSAASGQAVTVAYATANGTATSGSDYTAASGTLTFAAGTTSQTVAVSVTGDVVNEADETLTLNLSAPTNATIADAQGVGIITNDDPVPTIAVNDVAVTEGNTGTTTITFTVSLSAASGQAVTVGYATANGTATSGSDYTAASGTLTFAAGTTSQTVAVSITGDVVNEADETLALNLSAPTNATIGDAQGIGTITNDDPVPTIAVNDVSATEGNTGTAAATFTISLSAASGQTVTVAYATANGTATAGTDYTAASGTLTFAAGVTSQTVVVAITGDLTFEPNETLNLNLSLPANATIADAQGIGTIINDDATPTIAVNDVTLTEGNTGTAAMNFTVTLSNPSSSTVTVFYATANGTSTAGSDYTAASGTLTFAAGTTSQTVAVTVSGDALYEENETLNLNLSTPTNATIADAQGIGTITNDDVTPTIAVNDVSVTEGNTGTVAMTFTVSLSAASGAVTTVGYATANGTATAGTDYTAASGTLTFAAGTTSQTVAVTVSGDVTFEPNETLNLNLSTPANATLADAQGVGTITNDDATPTIAVNDVAVTEGNSGTTAMGFTITLSNPSSLAVTVAYATANGTATAGSDYTAASGTLTFAAGTTSQAVAVTVAGDLLNEVDETLNLNLSTPTNATIADAQGVGTITNDDAIPTVAVNDVAVAEGNTGTTAMTFTITLSAASGQVVTVAYTTANGTATAGGDYAAASGTLTFAAGTTSQTVAVALSGDVLNETDETLNLSLSTPTNAAIADGQGIGTITNDDAVPTLVVNDISVAEGNSGTSSLTFTVTLSAASGQTVAVAYATANGTATAGTDYTAASGTLTFDAGTTSQTISVPVAGDVIFESNETLSLNLSAPTNATIADAQGIGTITNDDATPTIAVNDVTVAEGNSGTSNMSFTVSLSNPSSLAITVAYATANGTATSGSDYTAASGTLTFAAGETSKAVSVTLTGDVLNEADETLTLNLSAPTNATIGDAQGIGTVTNDDPVPTIAVNDPTELEGNSGTKNLTFTVSLSAASGQAVTVAYATANGTATSGSDYTAASGTLTFAAGVTSQTVAVTITGDLTFESNETLTLNLSASTNATIADAQGIGTITNDDATPTIAVNDASVTEGNSGTSTMGFTVSLSNPSSSAITVTYATANGTATSGSDYTAASGTLTFAAGETSKNVAVSVTGDVVNEADETLNLNLSTPANATIADAQGIGTITNDDTAPTIAVNDVSVTEGNTGTTAMNFTVSLSAASGQVVTVAYATANGTAAAGTDYTAASGTLTFAAGVTSQTVVVTITGDLTFEPNETLTLNLSAPTNATIADAQGIGTITNDDATPTIAVNDVTVAEGNSGTSTMSFTVSLSNPSSSAITVTYATANGTATSVSDYTAASGTLTFAAGVTSQTVVVTITGDLTFEPNETLTLNLSAPANATIADALGIGTITNDDATPTIAVNDVSVTEGNSGTSTMGFTVSLSNPSSSAITVTYATANGTATSGSDYTAASGTLTFAAGTTSQTVVITFTGDALYEVDETLNLNLSTPTNATIGDAQGIGTLTNDDTAPTLSVNDVTVTEGNSGSVAMTFTVSQSAVSGAATTVSYATANGTATAGSDYTAASGTLTIAAGQTSQAVAITVAGDLLNEANETLTLNLNSPVNATIADAQGTGTITNDDAAPTIAVNDVTVTEGNSGTTVMSFTVTLSAASGQTVTLAYATANGAAPGSSSAALAGSDFTAASGTLSFAPGDVSEIVSVSVTGDLIFEPTETMMLNLSNAANGSIADAQGIGTITNDDTTPTISVNDVSLTEGNAGTTTMNFTVSLSNPSSSTITVAYATANGTATSGSDYTATNNTLTFAAGEVSKTVAVSISGDTRNEANETLTLNLSNPVNATIADAQGTGTITNDDPVPTISINDVSVKEGNSGTSNLTFTVLLSAASNLTVTVGYATANGTATAGSDYTAASGTLTFVAADTVETVSVLVTGDKTAEPDETLFLNLSSATNATIADAQGIGTITNDDGTAKVVADGLIGEGRFGVANYPNPFNPSTQVVYTLTEEGPVRLVIYNALGQQIRVLAEGLQAPGSYEVQWDGRDEAGQPVGAGWYLYRLEAGGQVAVGRMSLVK